ncbi:MAG: hypothetical protein HFG39_07770 [Lachnospiraceae bacterium]|nr:hypothetical protein [Lachnospiraceae bacterium]
MINNKRKFSLDEICQHSKELFGVYPEVIYGALLPTETKETYTLAEVEEAIRKFVKKEVV